MEVAGGGQSELRGRGNRRIYVGAGGFRHRQPGKAGILQLFHAQGQHDVVDPGGHGVAGVAESVGGGGAGVFYAGDGDVIQLQGIGQRLPGAKGRHGAQPGGLKVFALDAGVLVGFIGRLDHKVGGAGVPPLPELGAAHSDDGDSVFDSAHIPSPGNAVLWARRDAASAGQSAPARCGVAFQ